MKDYKPSIVMVDYGNWHEGVFGGLVRSTGGTIIIRISEDYKDKPHIAGAIASELIARYKRLVEGEPNYLLWPIKLILDELPDLGSMAQDIGLEKLTLPFSNLLSMATYRLVE